MTIESLVLKGMAGLIGLSLLFAVSGWVSNQFSDLTLLPSNAPEIEAKWLDAEGREIQK